MSLSTIAIVENKTESNNNTSELFIYDCKNCTADEDLYNNVTNISSPLYSFDSTSKSHHLLNRYTFTLSVTAACVVFLLLSLVGALCYFRRRQSYSFTATPTRAVTLSPTATVVYKRLKTKQQLKKSNKKTDDQHSSELLLDENVDLISNVRLSSLENEIHQAEK
ncbi:unnamed protein product [Didymodactylos carnosus]|nr:unnamed protein product [Didymodactylos carnosus]CAF3600928.1 unnamed protein product [Didymodactylos carnosus]